MNFFLVGGAVRDKLLGYPYHERDWVVVGATPELMIEKGFSPVGKDFPVFLHPETKEEYALARTERKSGKGYTGFTFHTSSEISLEQDLARRDLTINAIAESDKGEIIDPYNGRKDLTNKVLRHVTNAFSEDPVRILRVARFAARYHHLGFTVATETLELMKSMVNKGEVDHLVPERVWQEFLKALKEKNPEEFILNLKLCDALEVIMPELDKLFGVPQPEKHHPEIDTGVHSVLSLKKATELSDDTEVRFATLVHDLGKGTTPQEEWPRHIAHEKRGIKLTKNFCSRLKIPNNYRDLALNVCEYHTHCHRAFELRSETILKLFESLDAFRRQERFFKFLICCQADAQGRTGLENQPYPQKEHLENIFNEVSKIKANDFLPLGYKGKLLGDKIREERLNTIKKMKKQ